jgi:uncharacterized membrane protein
MKSIFLLSLALVAAAPMQAQIFRPEAVNGAVLGGVAGAIIGNNSGDLHHNAWRGAAYGAGAGLLIGAIAGEASDYRHGHEVPRPAPRTYVYREAPRYGYYSGYRTYPTYSSEVVYDGGYSYDEEDRPNYATSGLLLGGLAGAIIGNNSGDLHHNAWRGAAWGAGAGYLLGAIAEHNARRREAALTRLVASPAPAVTAAPAPVAPASPAPAPAPVSPMASANSLFGRD